MIILRCGAGRSALRRQRHFEPRLPATDRRLHGRAGRGHCKQRERDDRVVNLAPGARGCPRAGAGRKLCGVVTTDEGREFFALEQALPEAAVRRTKWSEDRNAMAVVDRTIQTLKKDLAGDVARHGGK